MVLDGSTLDHDAGRLLLFFGMTVWFSVRLVTKRSLWKTNLWWSAFFLFNFLWTLWDHCRPLRVWFPSLYR